jgi:hypothetical protein
LAIETINDEFYLPTSVDATLTIDAMLQLQLTSAKYTGTIETQMNLASKWF